MVNTFPTTQNRRKAGKSMALLALVVAGMVAATPAIADRKRTTTVIRETVYHTPVYHAPARVIVQPAVIIPVSNSVYVGLGSNTYVQTGHSHTTVYREVSRHDSRYDNYYDRGFNHPGRGNAFGHRNHGKQYHEPARGRWSGANRQREVIYVDRDGRRNSSYREAERRSVVIRERSR
ncbi:MAG: hypothetical protein Q7L19_00240 [Pseudohongiella sp.]|nr:hypothetical protein [Pseudohongiella sp.]